jgi:hypothetical protein
VQNTLSDILCLCHKSSRKSYTSKHTECKKASSHWKHKSKEEMIWRTRTRTRKALTGADIEGIHAWLEMVQQQLEAVCVHVRSWDRSIISYGHGAIEIW